MLLNATECSSELLNAQCCSRLPIAAQCYPMLLNVAQCKSMTFNASQWLIEQCKCKNKAISYLFTRGGRFLGRLTASSKSSSALASRRRHSATGPFSWQVLIWANMSDPPPSNMVI
jgi:hypothetical protein